MMHALPLVCLCVLTRSGAASADGPGPEVIKVEQDDDVILPCSRGNKQNMESGVFHWKKEKKEVFFYENGQHYNKDLDGQDEQFIGRVSFFQDQLKHGNASIIIRNTKMEDGGTYTCAFPRLQKPETYYIELVVGPEVIKVEQDNDVILPCSHGNKQNMESGVFQWKKEKKEVFLYDDGDYYKDHDGQDEQFKGRVSYFQDQLKHGNASIIIRNTKMEDAGTYTCAFPRLQKPETYYIELVVGAVLKDRSGENIPVAQKPYVTSLDETNDWVLLQCEAHGNPRPEVKWEDSSGNQLAAEEPELSERGSSFYVKLNVTVKKTDRYRCVATQETFSHQTHNEIFVRMNKCSSTGWIGIVVTSLVTLSLVGVLLAVFVYRRCIALNYEKGLRRMYETPPGNEEHQLNSLPES